MKFARILQKFDLYFRLKCDRCHRREKFILPTKSNLVKVKKRKLISDRSPLSKSIGNQNQSPPFFHCLSVRLLNKGTGKRRARESWEEGEEGDEGE